MFTEDQIAWLAKCHPVRWVVLQRQPELIEDVELSEKFKEFTGREMPVARMLPNPLAGMPLRLVRT